MDWTKKRMLSLFIFLVFLSLIFLTFVYQIPENVHRFLLEEGPKSKQPPHLDAYYTEDDEVGSSHDMGLNSASLKRQQIANQSFDTHSQLSIGLLNKVRQAFKKQLSMKKPTLRPISVVNDRRENKVEISHGSSKNKLAPTKMSFIHSKSYSSTVGSISLGSKKKGTNKDGAVSTLGGTVVSMLAATKNTKETENVDELETNPDLNLLTSDQTKNIIENLQNTKKRKTGELKKRLPNVIIIGSKKGGTRALLNFLSTHPDIQISHKEVHFFDKNYEKGINWYIDQMPATYPGEITLEKTPSYFVTPGVPFKLNKLCEERSLTLKYLVVLKDPVVRAISDYSQGLEKHLKAGKKKSKSFEARVFRNVKKKTVNTDQSLISIGLYPRHLKRWLKYFDLQQFHFVSGENLIKKPWEELYHVQKFLNISVSVTKQHFWFNKTKKFYCLVAKKRKDRTFVDNKSQCLGQSKGRKHPFVKEETLLALQKFFKPFNERFYDMVGRDFGWA